jgi:hypothetical protein
MQDVTINGTSVWNASAYNSSTVNFVTGYKYLGLPSDAFYAVCDQLKSYVAANNYTNTTVSCDSTASAITANSSCHLFEQDGNFTMQFATSATYVMKLKTLMHHNDDDKGGCSWNLRKTGSNTTFYVGEQFFQRFYTIFDNDNSRLGFGIYHYGAAHNDTEDGDDGDDDDNETNVWIINAPVDDSSSSGGMSTATVLMITGVSTVSVAAIAVVTFLVVKAVLAAKSAAKGRGAANAKASKDAPAAKKAENNEFRTSINEAPVDDAALL